MTEINKVTVKSKSRAKQNTIQATITSKQLSPTNYLTWQMPALKALCKNRGIPRSGIKPVLVKNLNEWERQNSTIKITTPKRSRLAYEEETDSIIKETTRVLQTLNVKVKGWAKSGVDPPEELSENGVSLFFAGMGNF